jgi:monoamine oxidase
MRVCVIGAGFAGLVAARSLAERGIEPVVLEARNRVGGRVFSQQLPNDAVAERGAEFAEPGHQTVARVAGWLSLGLVPIGVRSGEREPRGGIGATQRSVRDGVARLQRLLAAGGVELAGRSAAEVLDELPLEPGVRQAIAARLQVSWARPAEQLAASVLERVGVTFSPAESLRVTGGNQRIALRLAERLGPLLRLGSAADLVEWSATGVRVRAGGGWVEADRCVVAVPACVLDAIRFAPALPDWKVAALGRVAYGHAAKLVVPLERGVGPSAVLSVPDHFWAWTAKSTDGKVQPVVSAFAGSQAALDRLAVRDGPARWIGRLHELRPDLALKGAGAVLATWSEDPWSRGAYSTRPPWWRLEDEQLLARPVSRLHFAGEHTAGKWAGLMEGALRSGLRVADEIVAARQVASQETG